MSFIFQWLFMRRIKMDYECCGTCRYCVYDEYTGEWLCTNIDSDNYSMDTSYSDRCSEWEKR